MARVNSRQESGGSCFEGAIAPRAIAAYLKSVKPTPTDPDSD
ncbi:hypothetical protein [Phormidium sp. CCY1219]|nr:hypothetical protein [Phormidium sp. CCY1219]